MSKVLVNYNYETYAQVDIAEQKITSAILNVTSEKTPKAYFLTVSSSLNQSLSERTKRSMSALNIR